MGLMDILGGASGNQGSMLDTIMGMVTQHPGGLDGLVNQLKAAGLEKQVTSWVGNGNNLPVTADQLKAALGSAKINEIAKQAGISHDDAAKALAQHLPDIVNGLTPNGAVPQGDLAAEAISLFKSKFFS